MRGGVTDITENSRDEEAKVFLSYSRKDRERASGIADALRARHFGVFKDTDDILPTEEWKTRLQELIEEADTIVFLLSPHSAISEVCAWEVEYAVSLNKRIAPIVIEDVEGDAIPPLLARLNFIFCTARDPFENAVDTLASALSTDIEWIREHTRLAGLARRWRDAGRPPRLLLRGQDITDAEAWRDDRPADAPDISAAQSAFIAESRRASGRRQRNWVMGSVAVAAGAAVLAIFAYLQSVEADTQRAAAEVNAVEAERQRDAAETARGEAEAQREAALAQRDAALTNQSMFLANTALRRLAAGDDADALALAIEALPKAPDFDDRPMVPGALQALREVQQKMRIAFRLPDEFGAAYALAASPNGADVVMAMEADAVLLDVDAPKVRAVYDGFETGATAAAVSATGDIFAIGSAEGAVTVFSAESMDGLVTFTAENQPRDLSFSPDGARLAVISGDNETGAVQVLNVSTGEEIFRWAAYRGAPTGVGFDPTGDYLFTSAIDGLALAFDLQAKEMLGAVHSIDHGLRDLAIQSDAPILALAEGREVLIRDISKGEDIARLDVGVSPLRLEWGPEGDLFVGYLDGSIRRWRIGQNDAEEVFLGHDAEISALSVTGDGRYLVSASDADQVLVWRLAHDGAVERRAGAGGQGAEDGFDGEGRLLRVKRHPDGALIERADLEPFVLRLDAPFADAGLEFGRILIAEENGRVALFTMDGAPLGAVDTGVEDADFARLVTEDVFLTSAIGDRVRLFEFPSGEEIPFAADERVRSWNIDNAGGVFAYQTETRAGVIDFADPGRMARDWPLPEDTRGIGLSEDGALIALSRAGAGIEIRNWRTGSVVTSLEHPAPNAATDFAFSPDGAYFAAKTVAGWQALWRTSDWSLIRLTRLEGTSNGLTFSPDSRLLTVDDGDGVVRIIRTTDGKQHMAFPGDGAIIYRASFSPDGDRLLVRTSSETRVWPLYSDPKELIERATTRMEALGALTVPEKCRYALLSGDDCAIDEDRPKIILTMPFPDQ